MKLLTKEQLREIFEEASNVHTKNLSDVTKEYMKEYYVEVLLKRAVSDPRDGLKPIQRKGLFTLFANGFNSNKPHVKSAKVVGDLIGSYSPHGDQSAYDALVDMSCDWKKNILLVDFHGGNGSLLDNDGAAAYRYSEMRSNKISEKYLFSNLNDNVVDYVNNYDNTKREPIVLPSAFPLILINGAFGIAAGYQSNIPPCNPIEVLDNTIEYIKTGNYSVSMPDYPTGGIIINEEEVRKFLAGASNKKTSIQLRCKTEIEGNEIIITEIYYQTNVTSFITKIVDAVKDNINNKKKDKNLDGIKDIIDDSDKHGVRVRIVCKRGYDPEVVLNQLFSTGLLQDSFPISLIGSKNEEEFLVYDSQQEILDEWINFRIETLKRIKHDTVSKLKKSITLLEGMNIILGSHLDEYIDILKNGKGKQDILEKCIERFGTTEEQTNHLITNVPQYKLNMIDVSNIEKELEEKTNEINREIEYIKDPEKIRELLIQELKDIKHDFRKFERKTELTNIKGESIEKTIIDENFDIIVTEKNMIKKLKSENTTQKRGGKGQSIGKLMDGDEIRFIINVNSRDKLYFFTNKGKLFSINCYDLPETANKNRIGNSLSQFLTLEEKEKIVNIIPISNKELEEKSIKLSFVSRKNKIKLVGLDSYVRSFNVIGCGLNDDDELISVEKINTNFEPSLLCFLSNGNAVHLDLKSVPTVATKTAIGVMLFNNEVFNDKKVKIVSIAAIEKETEEVALITKNGMCKRVRVNEFALQNRGCKGMMSIKLKNEDELVTGISIDPDTESVKVVSNKKVIALNISDMPLTKRPTFGNKAKDMESDEEILDMMKVL